MPDPGLLGDVVLCPQVAAVQARDAGHSTQEELELLAVHGILHLLGYDHAEPGERTEMFGLQDRLLRSWRSGRQEDAAPETSVSPEAGGAGDTPGAGVVSGVSDAPRPDGAAETGGAAGSTVPLRLVLLRLGCCEAAAEASGAGEGGPSGAGDGAPAESLGRQEGSGLCRPRAG